MGNYILVVVDMQPETPWANALDEQTIAAVEREILAAKEAGCEIIFTEVPYWSPRDENGFPGTLKRLTQHLKDYRKHSVVGKLISQDGAFNVLGALQTSANRLRVCGVLAGGWHRDANGNIQYDSYHEPMLWGCVFALVKGISQRSSHCIIEVVQNACNDTRATNWDDFLEIPNVVLVPGVDESDGAAA